MSNGTKLQMGVEQTVVLWNKFDLPAAGFKFSGDIEALRICHTANISVVKYTMRTLCLFPSGTTDAVSTTDCIMLQIVVLWQKYNKYVVKFTMICCRRGRDLNLGPLQTYYCWMRALWAAKDSPSKVQRSVVYYDP